MVPLLRTDLAVATVLLLLLYGWWKRRALGYWLRNFVFCDTIRLNPTSRVMVIAPHCDDETLGAGGLIRSAAEMGCNLLIVNVTNGDGCRSGVRGKCKRINPSPGEYIRYAYQRQREALEALAHLGVARRDVIFLGYPDRGLSFMWTRHWSRREPYKSPFTKQRFSPYLNSYSLKAPHSGQALVDDLQSLMRSFRPSHVFIPHAYDVHPDHWATHAFSIYALEDLVAYEGLSRPTVFSYLIHRGKWPFPRGLNPHLGLAPPRPLSALGNGWTKLPLPEEVIDAKRRAVLCHRTQIAIMRKYLLSFVRENELFAEVAPVDISRREDIRGQGNPHDGTDRVLTEVLCAVTPAGDNIVSRLNGWADIRGLAAYHDDGFLYLRLVLRKNPRWPVRYLLNLKTVAPRKRSFLIKLRKRGDAILQYISETGLTARSLPASSAWGDLIVRIPLEIIGSPTSILVSAETRLGMIQVDRVGWSLFELQKADERVS